MAFAPIDILFDDILDFLASSPTAEAIINYHPSENLQSRLSELLDKNRNAQLSDTEQIELDEFLRMNRFMSRLKIKARQRISA
ncbi:MAG: hypothetical protein SH821_18175 [Phototrophicales bacterium]|mgnify:CR=1 FL=1|nr:hypothetical protein [Phototrophicales bacterium]